MPMYPYTCAACRHSFESFNRVDDRRKPECCVCPKCGASGAEYDVSRLTFNTANTVFAGSQCESLAQGFLPKEVQRARRLLPKHEHCIRDNGRVVFKDRKEEVSFRRAKEKAFKSIQSGA